MQYNDTPLYGHKAEHQFSGGLRVTMSEEEYREQIKKAEQRGARKEKDKIRKELEKLKEEEEKEKEEEKKKDKEKKKKKILWSIGGILFLVIGTKISFWIYVFLKGQNDGIDKVWFGVVVLGIIGFIWKTVSSANKIGESVDKDKVLFERAWYGFVKLLSCAFGNGVTSLALIMLICIMAGGVIGKFDMWNRTCFAGKVFLVAFKNYQNDDGVTYGVQQAEAASDQVVEENILQILKNYEGDFEQVEQIDVYPGDQDLVLNLSEEERGIVFFTQGDYKIENWDDQEEINAVVLRMVENERKKELTNRFDDEAPQSIQNEVAELSTEEVSARYFSEVKEIKNSRTNIYTMYPKKDLANLIANGCHKLALILLCHNGKQETILYFYSQSVIWEIEYIGYYDVSDSTVKDRLHKISRRYEDINLVCQECEETRYAEKLQIAFENAADHY